MQTSNRVFILAACCALAACDTPLNLTRNQPAPRSLELPDGTVIAGADGWCIDQSTSQTGGNTSVVVLGSCAALANDDDQPRPVIPGVVTVTVEAQPGAMPNSETLESFFVSEDGRAALARNGQADSVAILDTQREEGLLYLHAADTSVGPDASNEIWRALFGLGGRFVAVSLYTRLEDGIEPEDGLAALSAHVQEMRAANGV